MRTARSYLALSTFTLHLHHRCKTLCASLQAVFPLRCWFRDEVSQYSELLNTYKYYPVPTLITVIVLCVGHRKASQARSVCTRIRSRRAALIQCTDALSRLGEYSTCHLRRALPPCRTNSAIHDFSADRSSSRPRAFGLESFAHGCSVNEVAYLPQLVISPDSHNIDLVICLITAFSEKYRSGSTRVT